VAFQETDVYNIHRTQYTGTHQFRNQERWNDLVSVQAGTEKMYRALRGRLPTKLVVLFKIRDCSQDTGQRLAGVLILSPVNSGRPSDIYRVVTVQLREDGQEFTLVDIGTILDQAHLISEGDRSRVVNSRIDLRMYNAIYY